MTGLAAINGNPDDGPTRMGIPVVDIGTGLIACNAVLAALVERSSSGLGQSIEVSLYDCGIALLHPYAANFLMSGNEPVQTGNGHPNIAPYTMFDTAEGRIYLAIGNDAQFAKLCMAIGYPEGSADTRFASNASRLAHRDELAALLSEKMLAFTANELEAKLLGLGIPAGVVRGVGQALSHPHTVHRGMVAQLGTYSGTGIPARLSRTPGAITSPPPHLCEHNDEILHAAGYSKEEIAHFKRVGGSVIGQTGIS
jgi:crotonobetainyl-CoA:carnitine CoA-transferase CaiB-like acyl-CoA transferase